MWLIARTGREARTYYDYQAGVVFLIGFLLAAIAGLVPGVYPEFSKAVVITIAVGAVLSVIAWKRFGRNLALIVILATLVRGLSAFYFWHLAPDSIYYEGAARSVAGLVQHADEPPVVNWHVYTLSFLFKIFGDNTPIVAVLPATISAILVILTYDLMWVSGIRPHWFPVAFVAFFPPLVFWSSALLKDGIIYVLSYLLLLTIIKASSRPRISSILFAGILTLVLYGYRPYAPLPIFAALVVAAFVRRFSGRITIVHLLLIIAAIAAGWYMFSLRFSDWTLERLRKAFDAGNTVMYDVSTPVWKTLPVGIIAILFFPFPWEWNFRDPLQASAAATVPLWYFVSVAGTWTALRSIRSEQFGQRLLSWYVLITFAMYSAVVVNAGALFRHRHVLAAVLVVLCSQHLQQRRARQRRLLKPTHNAGRVGANFTRETADDGGALAGLS